MLSDEELDDLLRLAGETRPVSRAALDDGRVAAALDEAWHHAESNAARREAPRRARRPLRWRRLAAVGMAAVVVGVASLVGVEVLGGGSGSAGLSLAVSPAAAAQLSRVAHAAAAQPGLSAGQWQYVERTSQEHAANSSGTVRVQDWFAANGVERERVSLAGAVTSDHVYNNPSQGYAPSPGVNLAKPPSDVQTLLSDIARSIAFSGSVSGPTPAAPSSALKHAKCSASSGAGWCWIDLGNVLLRSTSPQLRSLALTALKYLPGVTVRANQTDQLGRAGTAFSLTDSNAGQTHTIIVSPSTGELLESYDTTTRPGAVYGTPAGAVVNRITYTRQTIVSSDITLPGGGTQPLTASEPKTTTPVIPPGTPTSAQALTVPVAPSPTPPSQPGHPQTATTPASSATTR
jgi:hypothetical protein